jgi:hypothetical protein
MRTTVPTDELAERLACYLDSGQPLGSVTARVEAAPWLRSVGLNRRDHPAFFPVPLARIERHLVEAGGLTVDDRTELLTLDRSPLPELTELAARVTDPSAAADLVGVLVEHWGASAQPAVGAEVRALAKTLAGARGGCDHAANGRWLLSLVDGVEDPARARDVSYATLAVLAQDPTFTLPADAKDRCRATIADDPALDPVFRLLLRPDPQPEPPVDPSRPPSGASPNIPAAHELNVPPPPGGPRRQAPPKPRDLQVGASPVSVTDVTPAPVDEGPRWTVLILWALIGLAVAIVIVALLLAVL